MGQYLVQLVGQYSVLIYIPFLKAFLDVTEDYVSVTYNEFKAQCEERYKLERFDGHLASMMTDVGKSHGKVFYREGDRIHIWPAVMAEIGKHFL